jgi:hypothetical protein
MSIGSMSIGASTSSFCASWSLPPLSEFSTIASLMVSRSVRLVHASPSAS